MKPGVRYLCSPCGSLFAPTRPGHWFCSPYCQGLAARTAARQRYGRSLSAHHYHRGGYYKRNPEAYK